MVRDFFLFMALLSAMASVVLAAPNSLILPDKTRIDITRLFITPESRKRGLSGVRFQDFGSQEGALFIFSREAPRFFWMPNTYFDLDIIYLDGNLKIISIARNVPHHPSSKGKVPHVPSQMAQYVLEIKSKTSLAKKIKEGMRLQFKGSISLEQIKLNTRPLQ